MREFEEKNILCDFTVLRVLILLLNSEVPLNFEIVTRQATCGPQTLLWISFRLSLAIVFQPVDLNILISYSFYTFNNSFKSVIIAIGFCLALFLSPHLPALPFLY
jgi:hypothetical protein